MLLLLGRQGWGFTHPHLASRAYGLIWNSSGSYSARSACTRCGVARMLYHRNQQGALHFNNGYGSSLSSFSSQSYTGGKDNKKKVRKRSIGSAVDDDAAETSTLQPIPLDKDRNRFTSYIKRAVDIIETYPGQRQPFSLFLKQYLASDRRAGAQDRRKMRQYCYPYFRLGHAFQTLPREEKILLAVYLLSEDSVTEEPLFTFLRPQWIHTYLSQTKAITATTSQSVHTVVNTSNSTLMDFNPRLRSTGYSFSWLDIFPFPQIQLSPSIQRQQWLQSMLVQPYLFLRIRPGKYNSFTSQLHKLNIPWKACTDLPNCIQLPSSTNLEFVKGSVDRDYVVQDYSSQRVRELLLLLPHTTTRTIWDCCAGSGGKSILTLDTLASYNTQQKSESGIQLTVSDKRSSILNQLKKRFTAAQIHGKYNVLELDLEQDSSSSETILLHQTFDLVIADVPCSGSGTWARTPEQLCCFTEEMLEDFVRKQRRILSNLPQAVATGGYLLYCTCSVFERENEEQVKWFTQTYNFTIEKSIVFNGINHRADTLFACLMRKVN